MSDQADMEVRRQRIRDAVRELYGSHRPARSTDRAVTSDLSIDEGLILHSIGWEPVELVCGAGVFSIPQGSWQWAVGEIQAASYAASSALARAAERLEQECGQAGGAGVIGVEVGVSVGHHAVNAVLVGTAVCRLPPARIRERRRSSPICRPRTSPSCRMPGGRSADWPTGRIRARPAPQRRHRHEADQSKRRTDELHRSHVLGARVGNGAHASLRPPTGRHRRGGGAGLRRSDGVCRARHRVHRLGHGHSPHLQRPPLSAAPGRRLPRRPHPAVRRRIARG